MTAAAGTSGFDWDGGNRRKCQKHGLSIADIEHVVRHGGRRAFVVFTIRERDGVRLTRPISARYMHEREARKYDEAAAGLQKRRGGRGVPRE